MKTRLFPCTHPGCHRSFRDEESQEKHSETHTQDALFSKKRFWCGKCLREFSTKQSLREHIYTHSGKKTFKCQFPGCGKAFRQSSQLCNHRKTHKVNRHFLVKKNGHAPQTCEMTEEVVDERIDETSLLLPLIREPQIGVKLPNFDFF